MKKRAFILIVLLIMINIPILNLSINIYPHTQNAPPFRVGMNGGLKFSSKMPHPSGWGVGVYSHENIRQDDVRITAGLDSHDVFYLNPSH